MESSISPVFMVCKLDKSGMQTILLILDHLRFWGKVHIEAFNSGILRRASLSF